MTKMMNMIKLIKTYLCPAKFSISSKKRLPHLSSIQKLIESNWYQIKGMITLQLCWLSQIPILRFVIQTPDNDVGAGFHLTKEKLWREWALQSL